MLNMASPALSMLDIPIHGHVSLLPGAYSRGPDAESYDGHMYILCTQTAPCMYIEFDLESVYYDHLE